MGLELIVKSIFARAWPSLTPASAVIAWALNGIEMVSQLDSKHLCVHNSDGDLASTFSGLSNQRYVGQPVFKD